LMFIAIVSGAKLGRQDNIGNTPTPDNIRSR
jgi:hypothetical protein